MADVTVLTPLACVECGTVLPHPERPGVAVLYVEAGGQRIRVPELQRCDRCAKLVAEGRLQSNLDTQAAINYLASGLIPASVTWLETRRGAAPTLVAQILGTVDTALESLNILARHEGSDGGAGESGAAEEPVVPTLAEAESAIKAMADSIGVDGEGHTVFRCASCNELHPFDALPPWIQQVLLTYNTGD